MVQVEATAETRREIELQDGRTLTIVLTSEGIIMDIYRDDEWDSTTAMTYEEWADFVEASA